MSIKLIQQFAGGFLILSSLLGISGVAVPKTTEPLLATAKGKGAIKVGSEVFPITSMVIKLSDDGTTEITLVSEITFFLSGKWTVDNASPNKFKIDITGNMTGGGVQGTGSLLLRADKKSIDRFSAEGSVNTSSRKVSIDFVAE